MNLTNKQKTFCEEYMIDLNATQAAIRAGYSARTADVIGCENLGKPNVAEYISGLMVKRSEEMEIDARWVLLEAVKSYKLCIDEGQLTAAKGFLELACKHVDVKAFDTTSTVVHKYEDWSIEQLENRVNQLDDELRTTH